MKPLFIFLMLAAIGYLWFDDSSQRAQLDQANARADAAEKQAQADNQQVQELTAQKYQLQVQVSRIGNVPVTQAGGAAPSTSSPAWFQQRLNGSPTALDPHGSLDH